MNKIKCEKCNKLNARLGVEPTDVDKYDVIAICDDCWGKRVEEYEQEKKKGEQHEN